MNIRKVWNSKLGFVAIMFLCAIIVGSIIALIAIFWLDSFTRHGKEVPVPEVVGMYVEEAAVVANNQGFNIEVIDSTYSRKAPLGAIMEQNPAPEAMAKTGRAIYVVINAKAIRQVPVPELRDMSYRQAEATLIALGFNLTEPKYEPSVYKNLVLDVKQGSTSIEPGARLKEGSTLTLVVGFGQGTEYVTVPELTGLSISAARARLLSESLIVGAINYDEALTESNAEQFVVYEQIPHAGTNILEGSIINLNVTTSIEKAASTTTSTNDEEDFF